MGAVGMKAETGWDSGEGATLDLLVGLLDLLMGLNGSLNCWRMWEDTPLGGADVKATNTRQSQFLTSAVALMFEILKIFETASTNDSCASSLDFWSMVQRDSRIKFKEVTKDSRQNSLKPGETWGW